MPISLDNNPHDFYLDVSAGEHTGEYDTNFTSSYQNVNSIATDADLWQGTGNLTWLTAASTLSIVSDSANDTALGTGARSIGIVGLDADWNVQTEIIQTNGLTPVVTTKTYMRINRQFVLTSGTYGGANIGVINTTATTGGSQQAIIPIQAGRLAKSHFSIPAGKRFALRSITVTSESLKPATFRLWFKDGGTVAAPFGTKQMAFVYAGVIGSWQDFQHNQVLLGPKTDLWITVTPSANNTGVGSETQGILVN